MKRLMYHLTFVGLLLFFGTIAKAVQDSENVLYLPFDEGKGAKRLKIIPSSKMTAHFTRPTGPRASMGMHSL